MRKVGVFIQEKVWLENFRRHITFRRRRITQKKAHNIIQVYVGLLISLKAQRLSCFAAESTSL